MKKILATAVICLGMQLNLFAQQPQYVNYSARFVEALGAFVKKSDTALWNSAMKSLRNSARLAKEEGQIHLPLQQVLPGKKTVSDEAMYPLRKSGVLALGRLRVGGGNNVNFEVMGTGFIVSKEGHCVTNHHVLQELLQTNPFTNDLAYFAVTEDNQVYLLNELLTYSRNNDLAVFKINGQGKQLNPIPLGTPALVGATVYCISHPAGELFYFSKGMVNRNLAKDSTTLGTAYSATGKMPIRMEMSADYGGGSSGGPVFDQYGNLVGIVATTNTIYLNEQQTGGVKMHPQMVIKSTIPVKALTDLILP